jgi:nucleotide-binding universal stress UspA family protein
MLSVERILCPAGLPPERDEALRYAASLAHAYHAKLYVCHCASAPALVTLLGDGAGRRQVKERLADSLARYLGRPGRRDFHWKVVAGEGGGGVGEEIVRVARERRADLIVMRSRRAGAAALLGSTAEQVSRTASCPVLVVRPKEQPTNGGREREVGFRRVLVSHDFSSGSELALSYALSIAQTYGAELYLIHVLPEPDDAGPEIAWIETGLDGPYHRAMRRLQASVPGEVCLECRVVFAVRRGKPYREVLAYVREKEIDLVCMGALGRDFGLETLFGSNADRVLRQARCPVLVARPLMPSTSMSLDSRLEAAR